MLTVSDSCVRDSETSTEIESDNREGDVDADGILDCDIVGSDVGLCVRVSALLETVPSPVSLIDAVAESVVVSEWSLKEVLTPSV
jgi:hypothetical protein